MTKVGIRSYNLLLLFKSQTPLIPANSASVSHSHLSGSLVCIFPFLFLCFVFIISYWTLTPTRSETLLVSVRTNRDRPNPPEASPTWGPTEGKGSSVYLAQLEFPRAPKARRSEGSPAKMGFLQSPSVIPKCLRESISVLCSFRVRRLIAVSCVIQNKVSLFFL